jgi:hypothetical protein
MRSKRAAGIVLGAVLALSQFSAVARAATAAPDSREVTSWRKWLLHTPRPGKGCFAAVYPDPQWTRVACTTAPKLPLRPRHGAGGALTVGDGTDLTAQVTGDAATAVGSFDSVADVTSETGAGTANAYTLQLNTQFFPTTTCSGGGSGCLGWEQFVFYNSPPSEGLLFIQYWLINYGACPSGWTASGGDCYRNSATAADIPAQTIATLGEIQLAGQAGAGGADDSTVLALGNRLYSLTGGNYFPDLGARWQISEFNIFGPGNSSQAVFNAGATLTIRTEVDSGASNAPACVEQGYTAETNNLTLVSAPASVSASASPSIVFTESNSGSGSVSCDSIYAIATTDAPLPWWCYPLLAASLMVSAQITAKRRRRGTAVAAGMPRVSWPTPPSE